MEYKNKLQTPQKALKLDKPKSTKSSKKKKPNKPFCQMYQYRSMKCNVVKRNRVRLKNKKPQTSTDFRVQQRNQPMSEFSSKYPSRKKAAFLNSSAFQRNRPKKMAEDQVGERCWGRWRGTHYQKP